MHPRYPLAFLVVLLVSNSCYGQCHELKSAASDGAFGDFYGTSVAIEGSLVVVGSTHDNDNGTDSGAVYVVGALSGSEIMKLTASDGAPSDLLGDEVAVSNGIAIAQAPGGDDAGPSSGVVYRFDLTTGTELGKLVANDAQPFHHFGNDLAASGFLAVAGATGDSTNGSNSGAAYLFNILTGAQLQKLLPSDGAALDNFGFSVDVHAATGRVVVGTLGDDDNGSSSGSAYVFDATTGAQLHKLLPADGAVGDTFGRSVAISSRFVVVGAHYDDDMGTDSGSVYVFDAFSGAELLKLTAPDGTSGDFFGSSVDVSESTIIVGAHQDDDLGNKVGSAYLFDVETGFFLAKLLPSDGTPGDNFGNAVAIDAARAVVGAPQLENTSALGAVYGYQLFSGTGEDFAMETLVNGSGVPSELCKSVTSGDQLCVGFFSPSGGFDYAIPVMIAQAYFDSQLPAAVFPGIAIDPFITPAPAVLFDGTVPTNPQEVVLLPPGGMVFYAGVPGLSGFNLLFQAYVLAPSSANSIFASTHGHVVRFQ